MTMANMNLLPQRRTGGRPSPGAPGDRAGCSVWTALALLLSAALLGACVQQPTRPPSAPPPPPALAPDELEALLAQPEPVVVSGLTLGALAELRRFYAARDHRTAFTGSDCARRMPALVAALRLGEAHGLAPADYPIELLSGDNACAPAHELLASDAWMQLAQHLHAGRVDPHRVEPHWTAVRPVLDRAALLEQALANDALAASLEALAPRGEDYLALREALALWRGRASQGDWPVLDDGPTLRAGDRSPRVRQLRERLAAEGFASAPVADAEQFDAELEGAVRRYQAAAHLEVDGAVGRETLAELRRSPAERVAQLRANLERWRWLPDTGERHIRVNIADFQLEARAGGKVERVHRIIVGRQARRTPSFSAAMRQIVVNPWWEVPRRLAVEDKLPLFQRDPAAVQRLGFHVQDASGAPVDAAGIDWTQYSRQDFPFRLRQQPGPQNALGEVKLLFPNGHDVYLHDTPGRTLFQRSRRNFSSGCLRTEDPLVLAAWALAETPGWPQARLDALAAGDQETWIRLRQPLPVHILYLTAVADDGAVRFVYDLYERDPALIAALGD